jgi:uncharacterized membrane protein (DUF106 family)
MFYFQYLDAFFGSFEPIVGITLFSLILIFIIQIPYKFAVDQKRAKEIKEEQKRMQEKMKEHQKQGDMTKANQMMNDSMKLTTEMFKMTMKPLMISFVVILIFLPWLKTSFADFSAQLPFSLPLIGNSLGWLGWYILISLPSALVFKKMMGIHN